MGILLIAGKCSFGWIADRAGSFRTAALFCLFLCIGQLLCCFAPQSGRLLFGITFLFLGMGLALASVGLSIMASDFCQVGNYATVLKNYQLSYALGGLVSSAYRECWQTGPKLSSVLYPVFHSFHRPFSVYYSGIQAAWRHPASQVNESRRKTSGHCTDNAPGLINQMPFCRFPLAKRRFPFIL